MCWLGPGMSPCSGLFLLHKQVIIEYLYCGNLQREMSLLKFTEDAKCVIWLKSLLLIAN